MNPWILILWLGSGGANYQGAITHAQFANQEHCNLALARVRSTSQQTINGVCVQK
jgi:hypothetical protein